MQTCVSAVLGKLKHLFSKKGLFGQNAARNAGNIGQDPGDASDGVLIGLEAVSGLECRQMLQPLLLIVQSQDHPRQIVLQGCRRLPVADAPAGGPVDGIVCLQELMSHAQRCGSLEGIQVRLSQAFLGKCVWQRICVIDKVNATKSENSIPYVAMIYLLAAGLHGCALLFRKKGGV